MFHIYIVIQLHNAVFHRQSYEYSSQLLGCLCEHFSSVIWGYVYTMVSFVKVLLFAITYVICCNEICENVVLYTFLFKVFFFFFFETLMYFTWHREQDEAYINSLRWLTLVGLKPAYTRWWVARYTTVLRTPTLFKITGIEMAECLLCDNFEITYYRICMDVVCV